MSAVYRHTFNLDFFSAVPSQLGFSAILPPEDHIPPISWHFDLDLGHAFRPFNFKHGMLGFSPEHAAMWIGRKESLDIWVIYVREDDLSPDGKHVPAGTSFTRPTQLSSIHNRQFQSWILHLLCGADYPGVYCNPDMQYSINLDGQSADWSFAIGFEYVHHFC